MAMQQQISPSCWSASCQTCCPFCFWSSATRVRLSSPIGPVAFHTQPCGRRLWVCAPLDRTTHGDLPGADFHRSRGPAGWHARLSCSACLRGGRDGRSPGLLVSRGRRLPPLPPLPFRPSPLGGPLGADVSITRAAPVVRIAGQSCDRTRAGGSAEVVPWWPRRFVVPHPMVVMGRMLDRGPKFWRGSEGLIEKKCQRNVHLVRNVYMCCSLTTTSP